MNKFEVNQRVMLQYMPDKNLNGKIGKVVGFSEPGFPIVLFDDTPMGYNPAIMISEACLVGD
jgi:hypothetical protein